MKQMGERGVYQPTTARHRITALERITSILADDEPKDARFILENIDAICDRWTRKEGANPETANTYLSRSKIALSDFFEYRRDPRGFKPRGRDARTDKPATSATSEKKRERSEAKKEIAEAVPTPVVTSPGAEALRTFPVAGGEFAYRLPGPVTVADVYKIACHLVTFAKDFGETEMPVFGMIRRDVR
ncbi:hypothetical protein AKJ08_3153 [Vulgatibacter incomptus]|uniref:Uncharacterized protein n=1 Tax=Vulgatibacter incomptus TaxID=1391653 RepID=A0A0K1PH94_9BACT|nr:hypothetical protein AKJ08_3153 [Vulgatibacter incomptus]